MTDHAEFSIYDLVLCLAESLDLVSPQLADHHKRVAYISYCLSGELGWKEDARKQVILAGAVHDVGGLSLKSRLDALAFELEKPYEHAEAGYLLLNRLDLFSDMARYIRFHHVRWENGDGRRFCGLDVPNESHLIHLADRVSVLIKPGEEILSQVNGIVARIEEASGRIFVPEFVVAFKKVARREYFWFDVISPTVEQEIRTEFNWQKLRLDRKQLIDLTLLFAKIIDFKSPFTATHSMEVAATAEALAALAGFSKDQCYLIRIAGYLHDLGKLSIPSEVLEKPASLTPSERNVIYRHTYYTDHILKQISPFDVLRSWAALHHERLDGSGYPYHLNADQIPLGARIVSIADVFSALSQDRPYRPGMDKTAILEILLKQAEEGKLDRHLVHLLEQNFDQIYASREEVAVVVRQEYAAFSSDMAAFTRRMAALPV
jgi:HD-GYP domain-containing protein (c-di-GMP phosphodiesterase class II)